eukprot:EG_transcript_55234
MTRAKHFISQHVYVFPFLLRFISRRVYHTLPVVPHFCCVSFPDAFTTHYPWFPISVAFHFPTRLPHITRGSPFLLRFISRRVYHTLPVVPHFCCVSFPDAFTTHYPWFPISP